MSQIVYTELEGHPVCWPYGQTRPFSKAQKLNTQNITGSAPTTEENIGLIEGADRYDSNIWGTNELYKFIKISKTYRVTKAVVRVKKTGSPPDNLYINVQNGGWLLQGYGRAAGGTSAYQYLYGNRIYVIRFQARYSGTRLAVSGGVIVTGSPPPIVVELRNSNDGSIMGSQLIASTTATVSGNAMLATFNTQIQANNHYSLVFYVQGYGGDGSNRYAFGEWEPGCLNMTTHYSDNGGATWVTGRILHAFAVGIWVEPTRSVTASVAASSVGTSYSDLTVTLPSSLLTENYVVIRIYSPNSNSSNYYSISVRDYTSTLPDELGFRGSGLMEVYYTGLGYSQSQWRCVGARAVGLEAVKIFETTINLVRRVPAAAPQPKIDIAFSGGTLTAVFKYGAVEEYVERTSSGTFLDKVMSAGTLLFQLYVSNGSTTVTAINYTEQVYFDKNPVTPRDFGFSELYLLRVDLPANGQVRLNDHAAGDLYSATATTITFTDFRIPVRKAEVIAGTPTLYFIGVI